MTRPANYIDQYSDTEEYEPSLDAASSSNGNGNGHRRKTASKRQGDTSQPVLSEEIHLFSELLAEDIPPPQWVIDGVLPEGLLTLIANPKAGKSLLVLMLCLRLALHLNADIRGSALYLALEDSKYRLQKRARDMLEGRKLETDFYYAMRSPAIGKGLVEELDTWLDEHPEVRLVIIDTFSVVKPPRAGDDVSAHDYKSLDGLHSLAHERHVAIIVVCHTNKRINPEDPFDVQAGTKQLQAVTDTRWLLKRGYGESQGHLLVSGRDVEEQTIELTRDTFSGIWESEFFEDDPEKEDTNDSILRILQESGNPLPPRKIAELAGLKSGQTRMALSRLTSDRRVRHATYGLYEIVTTTVTHKENVTVFENEKSFNPLIERVHTTVTKEEKIKILQDFVTVGIDQPVEPVQDSFLSTTTVTHKENVTVSPQAGTDQEPEQGSLVLPAFIPQYRLPACPVCHSNRKVRMTVTASDQFSCTACNLVFD